MLHGDYAYQSKVDPMMQGGNSNPNMQGGYSSSQQNMVYNAPTLGFKNGGGGPGGNNVLTRKVF